MINIIYIVSDINKAVFFENTALKMRERGVEISWILINSEIQELDLFLKKNGFRVANLTANSLLSSYSTIKSCREILIDWHADIVHCHLAMANWIGLWSSFSIGLKKRIFTRHSGKLLRWNIKDTIVDRIQNLIATHIVAISKNIKDLLIEQGVSGSKIYLIHHGFDLERLGSHDLQEKKRLKNMYNKQEHFPVVGVVARWLELKGIQYIIPAFKNLLINFPNAKLCLFNASEKGEYAFEIMRLLKELPPNSYECVNYEANVYDLYSLFDIYIHTPINPTCEAFGQTYVESLASGIPSIFTLSGVSREFVNDQNAWIVPYMDSDKILESMLDILQNNNSEVIAKGKKDVISYFTLETYVEKLMDLYTNKV